MKKVLLLLFSLMSFITYAQEPLKPASKLESFGAISGSMFKKEFQDIVKLKNLTIQLYTISDLNKGTSAKGIKLMTSAYNRLSGTTEYSTVIDPDEIDGLIKSIEFVNTLVGTKPSHYTEYVYTSRDGFKFAVYNNEKAEWIPTMQLERFKSDSYVFFKQEDMPSLIEIFKGCKTKL
jgi:hypothetical protein